VKLKRSGVAMTELAIAIPLITSICLVSIDLGRFAHGYVTLGNAARAGAERGAAQQFTSYTAATWRTSIEDAVSEEMSNLPSFDADKLATEITTVAETDALCCVTVTLDYPFEPIVRWPGFDSTITLHCQVSMRQFR
jgi:Flp pilus assembly protein TadG